jgi:phenylacetate-coenzyme A ligase PaaK-like adenylate-forming protein
MTQQKQSTATGNRTIHPHTFRSVFTHFASVSEYQVRQTPRGADVLVVPMKELDTSRLEQELIAALNKSGLPAPEVQIRKMQSIERHAWSQKLKRFVPL